MWKKNEVISGCRLRQSVFRRHNFTCQMCGAAAGKPHQDYPHETTHLEIWQTVEPSLDGTNKINNLRTVCSICYEGLHALSLPNARRMGLISHVQRASIDDQLYLLKWLEKKYAKVEPATRNK